MTRCDLCRGDIPSDEPNCGRGDDDICLWCEEDYLIKKNEEGE